MTTKKAMNQARADHPGRSDFDRLDYASSRRSSEDIVADAVRSLKADLEKIRVSRNRAGIDA
jgi:hypothetical protein